jgi:SAM-dependent methyltransferase
MHPSFLEYLVDPVTKEPLVIQKISQTRSDSIIEGILVSSTSEYEIRDGIPRFVRHKAENNYAASFAFEWLRWGRVQFESDNIGKPMQGHTQGMFERIVGHNEANYAGQVVLDVGCGSGRFTDVVRRKGGRVIAVDYSAAAEVAYRNFEFDDQVLVCQADALALPIKPRSVDGPFSIGVLHHTPDPQKGFDELVNATRNGGWVAIAVYGKGGFYDSPRVTLWRSLFGALRPLFGYVPPLLYAYIGAYVIYPLTHIPVLGSALRLVYPNVNIPDRRWRVLDNFDAITPSYQSAHTSFQVFNWFKEAGLVDIEPSDWGSTAYHSRVDHGNRS